MSGESGIECIGKGISSNEVPPQYFISRTPGGSTAVECIHGFTQDIKGGGVGLDDVQDVRYFMPGVGLCVFLLMSDTARPYLFKTNTMKTL